jgi:U4/U6.U5 tri-snRNP-associated protein 2
LASIPQIPLMELLKKFDGKTFVEEPVTCIKRKYRVHKLPKYLILHMKRFIKNEFFVEKNATIVNFPIKNLDLNSFVWKEDQTI